MKIKILIILSGLFLTVQAGLYKSQMIFNPQTNDQTPIMKLGEYLLFSFDELNTNFRNYNFTAYHCDRNWNRSNLFQSQYLKGYFNDMITNRASSFNTLQAYTHYEFQFPNQNITPLFSGNYELIVYEYNEEVPLLTYRFSIVEPLCNINLAPERNVNDQNVKLNQRVNAQVVSSSINFNQILNSMQLVVVQNNNWNKKSIQKKGQFFSSNSITFNSLDILFDGGNEFHFFDTKDFRVNGLTTQSVKQNRFWEHTLFFNSYNQEYVWNPDVNGAYYFRRFDLGIERDAKIDADYVWVLFGLQIPKIENKDVYVLGMFNNYEFSEDYKMSYNEEGFYELPLFLKQGYYNYQFATKSKQEKLDFSEIDGSFWQTENLYQAFFYVTPWGFSHDALVGYGEFRQKR